MGVVGSNAGPRRRRNDGYIVHGSGVFRAARLRCCVAFIVWVAVVGLWAPSALARWRPVRENTTSVAYNQGIASGGPRGELFFAGVSSLSNSGVYRTDRALRQQLANTTVIPWTRERYNHAGDLSFDPKQRRILLPLECYYPTSGGNTCGVGAIGVVDPVSLRFRFYVNLARRQIKKAMWAEAGPDGRWIWTSSGTHLLAYRSADITAATAHRQRDGEAAGIVGLDLGPVLPSGAVTGATFYTDRRARSTQLLLSLNLGDTFEIVSICVGTDWKKQPKLLSRPTPIITIPRSSLNHEPEGLATTTTFDGHYRPGGFLLWQMLPAITPSTVFSRILTYVP
jgi:hypothetical protein